MLIVQEVGVVDVRISTMPTKFGESVVMRLVNQGGGILTLDKLGMSAHILTRVQSVLRRTSGMPAASSCATGVGATGVGSGAGGGSRTAGFDAAAAAMGAVIGVGAGGGGGAAARASFSTGAGA